MIEIKYERYWNDFIRKSEEKIFTDLGALADWIFDQMQQDYTESSAMFFPTPEKLMRIGETEPSRIEFKPSYDSESIWIHLIENSDGIVFSDGRFTSGQKHWSVSIKDWLIACDKRQHTPKFNFVEEQLREPEATMWFAVTRWAVEDAIAAAQAQNVVLTAEQAEMWWKRNENRFQNLLTEYGSEVLANMDFTEVG